VAVAKLEDLCVSTRTVILARGTAAERILPLSEVAVRAFVSYQRVRRSRLPESDALFVSRENPTRPLSLSAIAKDVDAAITAAGFSGQLKAADLYRSIVTEIHKAGGQWDAAALVLGRSRAPVWQLTKFELADLTALIGRFHPLGTDIHQRFKAGA
jgi:site-specific recombinase XerD